MTATADKTYELMDEVRRIMDSSGPTPQGHLAMAVLLLNDRIERHGQELSESLATAALQGMLANPQIVGLDGVSGSPKGVYLLDKADSRLALCHRAVVIAEGMVDALSIRIERVA